MLDFDTIGKPEPGAIDMKPQRHRLSIQGMHCNDCARVVETAVTQLPGVLNAQADFAGDSITLELDSDAIDLKTVHAAIKQSGYGSQPYRQRQQPSRIRKLVVILIASIIILLLANADRLFGNTILLPDISPNASYSMIFLIGLLTSFHCIGMCGGLVVSYSVGPASTKTPAFFKHLCYGLGKLISYTFFGAVFGWLGAEITITLGMRSLASGLAGAFLIIYGLSMIKAFAGLRRLHIRLPMALAQRLSRARQKTSHPLMIGLLNGLMIACGPLQAMYILAAGSGSPAEGAILLALFALGTLPVMFVFGSMASLITAQSTQKMLMISGLIIIALGAIMFNRSMIMIGSGYDLKSLAAKVSEHFNSYRVDHQPSPLPAARLQNGYQVIYMEVDANGYQPDEFILQRGSPVKWVVDVKSLTGCNQQLMIPSLTQTVDLQPGLQLIEFTPEQVGTINWSCAMGMFQGRFIVRDANE